MLSDGAGLVGKKRKGRDVSRPAKQKSLRELFGAPGPSRAMQSRVSIAASKGSAAAVTSCTGITRTAIVEVGTDSRGSRDAIEEVLPADTSGTGGGARGGARDAAAGWAALRQRMAARHPVCRHGEPAVARLVKKAGPTMGRTFYCCARATVRHATAAQKPVVHRAASVHLILMRLLEGFCVCRLLGPTSFLDSECWGVSI